MVSRQPTSLHGASTPPMTISLCVPTLNAGRKWHEWLERTRSAAQRHQIAIWVVDSTSTDNTPDLARAAGCQVTQIERRQFDHGGTRDWALRQLHDCDIVVFLTQDALLADSDSLSRLVETLEADPRLGAVYGRQLPHQDATPIAAHARLFNYPPRSHRVVPENMADWGIKAAFLSNSFTAYRRQALIEAGGFPSGAILSEDMVAGARLLQAGWKLGYCAEAKVYHSHNYSVAQEFRRYFDIGVLHARESWILDMTGRAEGEGKRFMRSEVRYLAREAPLLLPVALVRNGFKYLGYSLGRKERMLPLRIKKWLSMNRSYWIRSESTGPQG